LWSGDDWFSFAGIAATSLAYSGAFFSLSLLFSAMFQRSSVSVLASVFAWVLLVLVVPNISPYLAAQIVRTPSLAVLERDLQLMTSEQRDQIGRVRSAKVREKYGVKADTQETASAEVKQRVATDPAFRQTYERMRDEIRAVWDQVNQERGAKARRMYENYQALAKRQFQLSRALSCASPLPPLAYALTEFSNTDSPGRSTIRDNRPRIRPRFGST
jgi:hypothetical protein